MLEILLLYFLCKSIGNILRNKGYKPLVLQILLVISWFGGEILGCVVAGVVHAIRHGDAPMEFNLWVYVYAIVGAGCGAGICFLIASLLPPAQDRYRLATSDFAKGPPSFLPGEPYSNYRTWTDNTGQYTVQAEFVSMAMGQVKLRRKDGMEMTVPMERLSEADQQWARNRAKRPHSF